MSALAWVPYINWHGLVECLSNSVLPACCLCILCTMLWRVVDESACMICLNPPYFP